MAHRASCTADFSSHACVFNFALFTLLCSFVFIGLRGQDMLKWLQLQVNAGSLNNVYKKIYFCFILFTFYCVVSVLEGKSTLSCQW